MSRTIRVHPEAEAELTAAVAWYEDRRPGLGVALLDALDLALTSVAEAPERHPLWRGGGPTRSCRVPRFPYQVLFEPEGEGVMIWAFAHARRRPGYWRARLEGAPP